MRYIITALILLAIAASVYADSGCSQLTYIYGPDGKLYTCQTCYGITTCYQ